MFQKFIAVLFILAMVHCTIYISFAQYKGNEISILIIEEEENSHSEHSSKLGGKIYEFVYDFQRFMTISVSQNDVLHKGNSYYTLHHKDSDVKPPLDNPPEV